MSNLLHSFFIEKSVYKYMQSILHLSLFLFTKHIIYKKYVFQNAFKKGGNIMPNYRPKPALISASAAVDGTMITKNVSTSNWGLVLVKGTAEYSDTVLRSGAVAVWEDTNTTTTRNANRVTFTSATGEYGITCRADVRILLKFYDN